MGARHVWFAAALGGAALAAPAGAQQQTEELLDYLAVRAAMPRLQESSNLGFELGGKMQRLMNALGATQDELEQRRLRGELRQTLLEYRAAKLQMIEHVRPLIKLPKSDLTDEQILDKLKNTELTSVRWDDANFDKCIRDVAGALGFPIRLQHSVVQKNKVSMQFQRAPAETILAALCNGFDLRYVIHAGEVVIYKKITPTEERFLDYKKRHPDVKLQFWEQEDASGAIDSSKKGGDK